MLISDNVNCKYKDIYEQDVKQDHSDVILDVKKGVNRFHNFSTGETGMYLEDVIRKGHDYIVLNFSRNVRTGYFVEYNEKFDVLVFRFVEFDVTRYPEENEIRTWKKTKFKQCFIHERSGSTYYYGVCYPTLAIFNHAVDVYYSSGNSISHYHEPSSFGHKKTEAIMRAYLGDFCCIKALDFTRVACSRLGLVLSRTEGRIYSKQKLVQHLIDVDMKDIPDEIKEEILDCAKTWLGKEITAFNTDKNYDALYQDKEARLHHNVIGVNRLSYNFAYIDKVIDGVACIRQFQLAMDFHGNSFRRISLDDFDIKLYEVVRVYITNKDFFVCKNFSGNWVMNKNAYVADYFNFILVGIENEVLETSRLKYYASSINSCIEATKSDMDVEHDYLFLKKARDESMAFFAMVSSPIYESLAKSEYSCFRDIVFDSNNSSMSIDSLLKKYFGDYDKTKTSFTKAVGVPSHVFKTVDKYYQKVKKSSKYYDRQKKDICRSISFFKDVFKGYEEYLQRIDDKTFDKMMELYYEIICLYSANFYYTHPLVGCLRHLMFMCGINNVVAYMEQLYVVTKMGRRVDAIGWFRSMYQDTYMDYVRMYFEMRNNLPPIDYKLRTKEDVMREHDNLVVSYNMNTDARRYGHVQAGFDKYSQKWKKFEYQEEEFSVVPPSEIKEIIVEGIALHHCVKSYIQLVSEGATNILFIRKSDDLKTPFFTLEIRNNAIRQCHGFANCNTDTVDGLDDFLKRFCKERKVAYSSGRGCYAAR